MDTKNAFITLLVLALGTSTYFVFQDKEIPTPANAVGPTFELQTSFKEASQRSAMAEIAELSCLPTSRYNCNLESGCVAAAPATYFFVDYGTESGTYFRCDAKGCDNYPVNVVTSGAFTQFIPSQGQAMLFKIANEGLEENYGEFVDIVTLGTGSVISFGKCDVAQ